MKRITGVLVGVLLLAAACGSSSSSALSKDEFVKQGNSICKTGNDTLTAAEKAAFPNQTQEPDPATLQKFFKETVLPNIKKQVDDIDKLKPPKDLESQVDDLVTTARAALVKLEAQFDKDPASAFSGEDPFADVNKKAAAVGLTACAEDSSSSSS